MEKTEKYFREVKAETSEKCDKCGREIPEGNQCFIRTVSGERQVLCEDCIIFGQVAPDQDLQ